MQDTSQHVKKKIKKKKEEKKKKIKISKCIAHFIGHSFRQEDVPDAFVTGSMEDNYQY